MDRVEFYSGEQVSSPEVLIDPTDSSGQFAVNAREMYSYGPQNRVAYNPYVPQNQFIQQQPFMNPPNQMMQPQTPQMVNFGGFGYNQMNPQFMGAPMNTPTMYPQQQGYQMGIQTMNPNQINTGFVGNPALQMWRQGALYQSPQQQGYYNPYSQQVFRPVVQQLHDQVVEVPGIILLVELACFHLI